MDIHHHDKYGLARRRNKPTMPVLLALHIIADVDRDPLHEAKDRLIHVRLQIIVGCSIRICVEALGLAVLLVRVTVVVTS